MSKHLGKLVHGLSPNMTVAQRTWFMDYYKKLCAMGRSEMGGANDVNDNLNCKVGNFTNKLENR